MTRFLRNFYPTWLLMSLLLGGLLVVLSAVLALIEAVREFRYEFMWHLNDAGVTDVDISIESWREIRDSWKD